MTFLEYSGQVNFEKEHYIFKMKTKKKIKRKKGKKEKKQKNKKDIKKDYFISIPNPTIDNNFKQIFGKNPKITRSLLNSFLFPKDKKIKSIEYISGEIPGEIAKYPENLKRYSLDSIRVDILCKCFIK